MQISLGTGTPAELVRPESGPPTRGLVLLPDIMGLRPLFADLAAHLANTYDWSVCCFEPWPGREELTLDERLQMVGTIDDDVLLGDAIAAAEAVACEPVAILGFCMGGMFTLKATATGRFDRAVSFYGMARVPEHWQSDVQGEPLDALANRGATEVLAIVGTKDPWVPTADADALEAAGVEVVRYEGADHGFVHDADRPTHRADDAADAWRRVNAFLSAR